MKKGIYFIGLCLAISVSSCDDFLSVESPDQMDTKYFWRNEQDVQDAMASVYAQLYHGDAYATSEVRWPVEAYRTDLYELGKDAINYDTWTDLYKFTYTNGNTQFSYYYQDLYRGINFANQIIEHLPDVPDSGISAEKRNMLMNEACFMRGYYHMTLLLNWEKIVIRRDYIESDDDVLAKPLTERKECWNYVIEDLKKGEMLPPKREASELGRATSGTANAYIGYAYLTMAYEEPEKKDEYLTEALTALDKVTGYELVGGEDLINMFNGKNKNCKESIFEIQYSKSTANGASYNSCIHFWMASSELGGWDEIAPSQKLFEEFQKEGQIATTGRYDSRLYNTIYFKCDYFNDGTGRVIGVKGDECVATDYDDLFVTPRPVFRKFTAGTPEELAESRCAFNIPLMRYSNVLLMKAEVLNEQGHPELAIPLINDVRRVHGDMPEMEGTTQDEVRAQIEHERILEFPLEDFRWHDLRRWGKIKEALGPNRAFIEGKHEFYPIPLWEITSNTALQ